ncbi:MAG: radical SAM family heme chaperone HemW [Holophagales bacterium]|nr:radical SAM family heme chaperone HemW [Holophagales bacterium]
MPGRLNHPMAYPNLGLYIHAPFCQRRCAYCSFTSTTALSLEPLYVKRLLRDMADWGRYLEKPALETVYMGGGTPSLLSQDSLAAISRVIHSEFDAAGLLEATLEANPGTLSPEWLKTAMRGGWNRLSLGAQTLDNTLLQRLGRVHDAAQCLDAVKMCKDAGFDRISADLLLGAPGQRMESVQEDAARMIDAGVEHLSVYILDLDKQCPLKFQVDNGLAELPPDELVAQAYQALMEYLPQLGLDPYEISNYSRPGRHSVHNIRYWQKKPYIGLGPGAAGNIGNLRWTESENIAEWINDDGQTEIQFLSLEESLAEIPLLALRLRSGVNWSALRELAEELGMCGLIQNWERELAPFIARGLLRLDGENMRLTTEGTLVSNQIFQAFV